MPRYTIINTMTAIAAIALPAAAHAKSADFDCQVTEVVDRKEFVSKPTFWAAKRSIKPEYRRITTSDDTGEQMLTYGLGENKPQNWTVPIVYVGKRGEEKGRIEDKTSALDQWGHSRWVYFDFDDRDHQVHFWTTILYPDQTVSASIGTCQFTAETIAKFEAEKKTEQPALREPIPSPKPAASDKIWTVPIERRGRGIAIDGRLNDTVPVRWALDTGASISNIPYDLAVKLNAKVIREQKFEQADGTIVTNQVILIKKLAVGDVYVADVEASVTARSTTPLLGKNFLDSFSSYEINNAQSQLILRQ